MSESLATSPESLPTPILHKWLPLGTWRRRLFFTLGIPLFCLLIIAILFDQIFMPIITRQGSEFQLPDLTNERLVDAQITLYERGLDYEISAQEYTPGTAQGIILSQYPIGGSMVKPGRKIKFVISAGQKMVPIPDLAGSSVRQAILDLETSGLKLGEIAWAFSDTIPERVVVFSYPSAGSEIPIGSQVNLMVNRGRVSTFTFAPKLVGMRLEEAKKELIAKSLRVGVVSYRREENFLPETVLEQSQPEGAELDVNSEVDLVVSSTQ